MALALKCAFVPLRKPGKLPGETISESYTLEYGSDTIEMHTGAVKEGQRVLLIDDLIATGGTMGAGIKLMGAHYLPTAVVLAALWSSGRGFGNCFATVSSGLNAREAHAWCCCVWQPGRDVFAGVTRLHGSCLTTTLSVAAFDHTSPVSHALPSQLAAEAGVTSTSQV